MPCNVCILGTQDERLFSKLDFSGVNISDPAEAQLALYGSILWGHSETPRILDALEATGHSLQIPLIVFIVDDFEAAYGAYNWLILCRTSLTASHRQCNELVLPYLWECRETPWEPSPYEGRARIGFCGLATGERTQILDLLEAQPDFQTAFIRRSRFWGGKPHDPQLSQEFEANMKASQFIVAHRGAGNFSMRFYQTLAAGRIPILLDSDLCLPFDHSIDWEGSLVISPSLERLPQIIRHLCEQGEVETMQQRCGAIFQAHFTHLSIPSFMTSLEHSFSRAGRWRPYETRSFT